MKLLIWLDLILALVVLQAFLIDWFFFFHFPLLMIDGIFVFPHTGLQEIRLWPLNGFLLKHEVIASCLVIFTFVTEESSHFLVENILLPVVLVCEGFRIIFFYLGILEFHCHSSDVCCGPFSIHSSQFQISPYHLEASCRTLRFMSTFYFLVLCVDKFLNEILKFKKSPYSNSAKYHPWKFEKPMCR